MEPFGRFLTSPLGVKQNTVSENKFKSFFNTFNELYNNDKQIIISSDRSPDDIKKLEERNILSDIKDIFNSQIEFGDKIFIKNINKVFINLFIKSYFAFINY